MDWGEPRCRVAGIQSPSPHMASATAAVSWNRRGLLVKARRCPLTQTTLWCTATGNSVDRRLVLKKKKAQRWRAQETCKKKKKSINKSQDQENNKKVSKEFPAQNKIKNLGRARGVMVSSVLLIRFQMSRLPQLQLWINSCKTPWNVRTFKMKTVLKIC